MAKNRLKRGAPGGKVPTTPVQRPGSDAGWPWVQVRVEGFRVSASGLTELEGFGASSSTLLARLSFVRLGAAARLALSKRAQRKPKRLVANELDRLTPPSLHCSASQRLTSFEA